MAAQVGLDCRPESGEALGRFELVLDVGPVVGDQVPACVLEGDLAPLPGAATGGACRLEEREFVRPGGEPALATKLAELVDDGPPSTGGGLAGWSSAPSDSSGEEACRRPISKRAALSSKSYRSSRAPVYAGLVGSRWSSQTCDAWSSLRSAVITPLSMGRDRAQRYGGRCPFPIGWLRRDDVVDMAAAREAAMDIRLKRAHEQATPDDGWRVLIDRLWPRGVSRQRAQLDAWEKDLAPSTELRQWFGHEPSRFQEFPPPLQGVSSQDKRDRLSATLRRRARAGTLTLIYSAHDTEHNDAVVLAEVLRARPPRTGGRPQTLRQR